MSTPAPATLIQPTPHAGHTNRYASGCRCRPCTRAATLADAQRRVDRLAGRPRSLPVEPVLKHIQALRKRLTPHQIARESGVESATIRRILSGNQRTVRRPTAEKVLAVPLNVRVTVGDVPALGATRRIRALYALGHYNWIIAQEADLSRDTVCYLVAGQWRTLKAEHDLRVRRAYDRLSMRCGESWKTKRLAQRKGWAPPLAWDDDLIDDPNAVPQWDAPTPPPTPAGKNAVDRWLMGESVILSAEDRREAISHLMQHTSLTADQIAERMESTPEAVRQAWERIKKRAREAGQTVPYRRLVPSATPQTVAA